MQVLNIRDVGTNYVHTWGDGSQENYPHWIEYDALSEDGSHIVRLCFGLRETYGIERARIIILIDGRVHAEFLGADNYEDSGDVLSEIRIPGEEGLRMPVYREEPIPERYTAFNVIGLSTRVSGPKLRNAWVVLANISDHKTLIALAALRRFERNR